MSLKKHCALNVSNRTAAACLLTIPMLLASFLVPLLLCITIPPLAAGIFVILGSKWYVISMMLFSIGSGYWVYTHKNVKEGLNSEIDRACIIPKGASDDYTHVTPKNPIDKKSEGNPHIS